MKLHAKLSALEKKFAVFLSFNCSVSSSALVKFM